MNPLRGRPPSSRLAACFGAGALLGLAGCLDAALVAETAFPARMAGLAPDQPWVPLPVGRWLTESGIEPVAVAACLAPGCEVRALVSRFRAKGSDAAELARMVDDPERLVRELSAPGRPRPSRRGAGPAAAASPERRAAVSVSRLTEKAGRGFIVRMSRPDGSRPAYGAVLSTGGQGDLSVLMVVASSEDGALRLLREIGLGGG